MEGVSYAGAARDVTLVLTNDGLRRPCCGSLTITRRRLERDRDQQADGAVERGRPGTA
jgi:hypothetical protein